MNQTIELIHGQHIGDARSGRLTIESDVSLYANDAPRASSFQPDEEVVTLVHQVFLRPRERPLHTVMFAGVEHGNGCTRVAAASAIFLAKNGGSVCLVDTNLHSPSLAKVFEVRGDFGLTESLNSNDPIRAYTKPVDRNLWLLTSGEVGPGSSIGIRPDRLKARLDELQREFTYVILDAPPLSYLETLMLGQHTCGLIMVLEADRTRRDAARAATERLRSSGIEILGAVLNKRTFPMPEKLSEKI